MGMLFQLVKLPPLTATQYQSWPLLATLTRPQTL